MTGGYRSDLAYIHDVGFGNFAREAAPFLVKLIQANEKHPPTHPSRLVVDLGCGSGIWAQELCGDGYRVLGIDLSPAMIDLARKRVPQAEFRGGSFLSIDIPSCAAVTAIGEIFSYCFDEHNTRPALSKLFRRIHEALEPRGLLIFDVAAPGRVPGKGEHRSFREGEDWAVLLEAKEDKKHKLLTRRITSFRRVGEFHRRNYEVHRLRLFERAEIAQLLRREGFRVRTLDGYGRLRFARGHIGFIARKS
jgi:SAM-dependent methyltransferase